MADPIPPVEGKPIFPDLQKAFGEWLFSFLSPKEGGGYEMKPVDSYPGFVTAQPDNTRLRDVQSAWQPYDAGTSYLLDYFANNKGGIGQNSPLSQQMMATGGTGGYGNNYMNLMAQYGTPSQAGQPLASMAQNGYSSPGAGGAMAALANGQMSGPASFLAPFLMHGAQQGGGGYQAPPIYSRPVTRRA